MLWHMAQYHTIAKALAYLYEHQEEQPTLAAVARHVHLSPYHFQRLFTQWAGVSPKTFLQYLSIERAKGLLAYHSTLRAAHKVGLSGTGRLHDLFMHIEGMTPGEYKRGGAGLTIAYTCGISPFGTYLVAATAKGVCNLFFYDGTAKHAIAQLRSYWPQARLVHKKVPLHAAVHTLLTTKKRTRILLHVRGTPFQLKVWQALLSIPEGSLASYQQVARDVKAVNASRAVGNAVAHNPVAYLIPCHRVIKTLGVIGSYHWGEARKLALIGTEAARTHTSH